MIDKFAKTTISNEMKEGHSQKEEKSLSALDASFRRGQYRIEKSREVYITTILAPF